MILPSVHEIFTPNDAPTYTYVNRSQLKLEEKLRDALDVSKMIVSVSGPSKSGKSVLIRRVIDHELLIEISGSAVRSAEDIWDQALQWMGGPRTTSITKSKTMGISGQGSAGGEAGLPGFGKAQIDLQGAGQVSWLQSATEEARHGGMQEVVKEIGGSDYLIFIDDFHYIPRETQLDVGKQLKAIVERGVKVCAASVPHRSDDVVRSNPELSGRVASIRIDPWDQTDLALIGNKGFSALDINVDASVIDKLAAESFGAPQLMQALCLNLCLKLNVRCKSEQFRIQEVTNTDLEHAFEATSDWSDYSSVVQGLHSGPKERGTERKQFALIDGSFGDVYRVVLLALSQDPPSLSFTYDELIDRVGGVCSHEKPVGSSITQSLTQMEKLSQILSPSVPLIEWNENVLDIVEPYFLFFLRASKKLERLKNINTGSALAVKNS